MIPHIAHLDPLMRIVEEDASSPRDARQDEADRPARDRAERDPPPTRPKVSARRRRRVT